MSATSPAPSLRFLASYLLAQTGAFVAFVPLLQVLVPQRVQQIAPAHAATLLGSIVIGGAIVASVANVAAGTLSDMTPARRGGRRSWLLAGLVGVLLSYWSVAEAQDGRALLLAVVGFQIAFNTMFAPLTALLVDKVPPGRRGMVAALLGMGNPIGSALGITLAGLADVGFGPRLALIGACVAAAILPVVALLRQRAPLCRQLPIVPAIPPAGRTISFAVALASRLAVSSALNLVQTYLLFFLEATAARAIELPAPAATVMARMVLAAMVANVACGLVAGALSDRIGGARWFILCGAAVIGAGTLSMAMSTTYSALLMSACLWGGGTGIFQAVDLALMARLLPGRAGGGFGIVNLANTLPQVLLPSVALLLLHGATPDYRGLFWLAAATAIGGGLLILRIRPEA